MDEDLVWEQAAVLAATEMTEADWICYESIAAMFAAFGIEDASSDE